MNRCFWITGLPGAGKTTLAKAFQNRLEQLGINAIYLDGDELRYILGKTNSHYSKADRLKLAKTYARLCQTLSLQGHFVICATVSMFDEVRKWNRLNIPQYIEVFVDAPNNILNIRNQKGLYSNQDKQLPGQSQEIELPRSPDYCFLNDNTKPVEFFVDKLIQPLNLRTKNEN